MRNPHLYWLYLISFVKRMLNTYLFIPIHVWAPLSCYSALSQAIATKIHIWESVDPLIFKCSVLRRDICSAACYDLIRSCRQPSPEEERLARSLTEGASGAQYVSVAMLANYSSELALSARCLANGDARAHRTVMHSTRLFHIPFYVLMCVCMLLISPRRWNNSSGSYGVFAHDYNQCIFMTVSTILCEGSVQSLFKIQYNPTSQIFSPPLTPLTAAFNFILDLDNIQ